MNNLSRYENRNYPQSRGFGNFYNLIDNFFDNSFPSQFAMKDMSFKVDIKEDDDNYLVEADLPGFKKDEVELHVENGRLSIKASKNENNEEKDDEGRYLHRERKTSTMLRTMQFDGIDEDNLKAKLDEGVLRITLPKASEDEKRKMIEIQ